jgi:DNA-binding NarL/FixJ family response regulator
MLHADKHTESAHTSVSEFDRHLLVAEGLGMAFERNQTLERLRAIRAATDQHLRGVNALADDFTADVLESAGLSDDLSELLRAPFPSRDTVPPNDDIAESLTRREREVVRSLATGKTNAQIAASLFVSEGTVKSHVKHILRKLGAANRTDAVAKFHRLER